MLKCHYVGGQDVQNVEIQWNPIMRPPLGHEKLVTLKKTVLK